jgi:hypothetical protein
MFNTVDRIKQLKSNLLYLEQIPFGNEVEINRFEFITPLSITPIAAIINSFNLNINYTGINAQYLKVIHFPEGVSEIERIDNYKSYIPIIRLPLNTIPKQNRSASLNSLHSKFLDLLKRNVIAEPRFIELISNNTFGFLMGEMLDNIEEHAQADNVYVFAQYWPKNNSCELCIVDDGQGLLGSLVTAGREVSDSMDALQKILNLGLSAKTEYGGIGGIKRGMGIKSTRDAITNKELNGEFFVMSGNSAFLHTAVAGETFITLQNYAWKGTIVMMKLNRPDSSFNLYNYVR